MNNKAYKKFNDKHGNEYVFKSYADFSAWWFNVPYRRLKNLVTGSVSVTDNGGLYGVEIKVGVQSFKLGYETDDETSAYWMAFQLGNALIETGGDFLLQNVKGDL